jgi:hypothetical protein
METLKKIFKKRIKPKETATAEPELERAILPKAERRIKRANC